MLMVTNASKVDGKIKYLFVTVTLLYESIKFLVCVLVVCIRPGSTQLCCQVCIKESLYYAVPALLYMLDNNISYVMLRYITPVTATVLWQTKILTTAVLFRCILKRRLTNLQWVSIVLLLLGVVTSQSDHLKGDQDGKHNPNFPQHDGKLPGEADNATYALGLVLVFSAVLISSLAGVYTEWVLKRKREDSFFLQSAYLYFWGVVFNAVALFLSEGEDVFSLGFFYNYNRWCIAIIAAQVVYGLTAGVIYKFLDNIAAVFAHSLAMIVTMTASAIWLDFQPTLTFVCGVGTVFISMYLYHTVPNVQESSSIRTKSGGKYQQVNKAIPTEEEHWDGISQDVELAELQSGELPSD